MLKLIRYSADENSPDFFWAKLATLNNSREAVTMVIHVETDNIARYVKDNSAALEAQVLSDGEIDQRLTAKLRSRDADRLLRQSRLEGKTLDQVESFVEDNFTAATAKSIIKELAGQIWMLHQIVHMLKDQEEERSRRRGLGG